MSEHGVSMQASHRADTMNGQERTFYAWIALAQDSWRLSSNRHVNRQPEGDFERNMLFQKRSKNGTKRPFGQSIP
jgi:hypothetical protein